MINFQPFGSEVESCIRLQAEREFPDECCGFILTDGSYVELENIHENPSKHFRISDKDYLKYEGRLACVVHSHPGGPNYPTKADMIAQRSFNVPWAIAYVNAGGTVREIFYWGDFEEPAPLLGRSFKHGVYDCFSLVRDWYWVACGVRLPMMSREHQWWDDDNEDCMFMANYKRAGFEIMERIDIVDLRVGDIIIGNILGPRPNHCGVYVGNNQLLHHFTDRLSKRDLINLLWRYRAFVIRYKKELTVNEQILA